MEQVHLASEIRARDIGREKVRRRYFLATLDMDQEAGIEALPLLGGEMTQRLCGARVPEREPCASGIGKAGIDGLDLGAQLREGLGCAFHRCRHLGVHIAGIAEPRAIGDAQTLDAVLEPRAVIGAVPRQRVGIAIVGAGEHGEQQRAILHRPRHRPGVR